MKAMVLDRPGDPLRLRDIPDPDPGPGQIRLRVAACGVCRTDLHVVDGELGGPALPLVPGHQIALVPAALACTDKGGRVVCAGIHMSDVPSFPDQLLWNERSLVSVANLTRQDGADLLAAAAAAPIRTHVTRYPLVDAGRALDDLRHGRLDGAAVLVPD
jgi:D-arabinose 1-dehydrogenase-like Zn-dependent alcohol dehydrogenase